MLFFHPQNRHSLKHSLDIDNVQMLNFFKYLYYFKFIINESNERSNWQLPIERRTYYDQAFLVNAEEASWEFLKINV